MAQFKTVFRARLIGPGGQIWSHQGTKSEVLSMILVELFGRDFEQSTLESGDRIIFEEGEEEVE